MAGKKTIAGEQALEYCNKFPNTSSQALARKLINDFPLLYKSLDTTRAMIRTYRGGSSKATKYMKQTTPSKFSAQNPYNLPESYAEKREPFVLPVACNNILLISDLHVPYFHLPSLTTAIKYGVDNKVNTIFINGDFLDFHGLSRFDKDPRKRSVKHEIEAGIEILKTLRKTFPRAAIYWGKGNHCVRYENWLRVKVTEIFDDEYFHLEDRMGLINLRVKIIDGNTITKAGKLNILHGHTIFRGASSPVSPARTLLLKTKQSTICGHTHKISEATEIDIDGNIKTCFTTGSLAELSPDYAPHCNNYAHGFAHILIGKNGNFTVKNMRLHEGKIL